MKPRRALALAAAIGLVAPLVTVGSATAGNASEDKPLTATTLTPVSRTSADKAPSSRLAKSDPKLLKRTDDKRIPVLIKLDYDSLATYSGDLAGLAATSPSVTGTALRGSTAEDRYETYVADKERDFRRAVSAAVPSVRLGTSLRVVYGGVAATLPASQARTVARLPGVVAVQRDYLRTLQTDASPHFIGADTLDGRLHGAKNAGKGIVFGSLDSGVWPEHPSFADQGNLPAPPPKADGTPRTCDFGDNPLTSQDDPFRCNHKLIGGAPFIDTYNANVGGEEYADSARDSDGHGTHTASSAAGDVVRSAPVFGVERGPIRGIAPGAWVSVYKVCGAQGCFSSDSLAAVQQAILDGVDVINYSISGGGDPYTDPVELAFLDAYAAGVFVAASAGNSGPGASTTDHVAPWVTTVAASTQRRDFGSTITLTSGGDRFQVRGASITAGVTTPAPVVMAADAPYGDPLCQKPAPAGTFDATIVVCERGVNARVEKGYNVAQGGAVGMILYNPALADVETDNHWLPAVHVPDGTELVAWMASHTDVMGSFPAGQKGTGVPDVMAAFSSRGPGGLVIKPDITAPGVQILAGNTPTPDDVTLGPPGEYFQAIAGTSMSSPHIAGAAALMMAVHPTWSPAQIKSALMSTARTAVLKEDESTPADPFDYGSGRVDLSAAPWAGLTFDETADRMLALGGDPVQAMDLNLASIDAPVMPGEVSTTRTVRNVTNATQHYRVRVDSPRGSTISVSPRSFTVRPGRSVRLRVTITSTAASTQQFGMIRLVPARRALPVQHVPVAFVPRQGGVTLASDCAPGRIPTGGTSTCTVTATNTTSSDTTASVTTTVGRGLKLVRADGARRSGDTAWVRNVPLAGGHPGLPSIAASDTSPAGYLPLAEFGIAPEAVGDEDLLTFGVPTFQWAGQTYDSIGVTSNGYLVVGGGTSQDIAYEPSLPSPGRPNNVIAPFWTDLTGENAPGISAGTLTDGTTTWIVVQWDLNVWGGTSARTFQVWIQTGDDAGTWLTYDPANLPADPNGQPYAVGVENSEGAGQALPAGQLPAEDLEATSTPATPGASLSYTLTLRGTKAGTSPVRSVLTSPIVPGTTKVTSTVTVTGKKKHKGHQGHHANAQQRQVDRAYAARHPRR